MILQRIVFSLDDAGFGGLKIDAFNRVASYLEDTLFRYLPPDINCSRFETLQIHISFSKQCAMFYAGEKTIKAIIPSKEASFKEFFDHGLHFQGNLLLDYLQEGLKVIETTALGINRLTFEEAINNCRRKLDPENSSTKVLSILLTGNP